MAHREDVRAYLEGLTIKGYVIDWGCGAKPAMRYAKDDGAAVYTVDKNPDVKPDYLHDVTIPLFITKADHAFCMEVLEHTTIPSAVLKNIYNNLKAGGILHLSVPFLYPKHGEEDYWRFTDLGLELMAYTAGFNNVLVQEIEQGYIMEAEK